MLSNLFKQYLESEYQDEVYILDYTVNGMDVEVNFFVESVSKTTQINIWKIVEFMYNESERQ